MRWDRVGRLALLLVLAVVVGLYVEHALSWWSMHQESRRDAALVQQFQKSNAKLLAEQKSLQDPVTIERTARALGMIKPGERSYVVSGLPKK